jgi:hypothetical protein
MGVETSSDPWSFGDGDTANGLFRQKPPAARRAAVGDVDGDDLDIIVTFGATSPVLE